MPGKGYSVTIDDLTMDADSPSHPTYVIAQGDQLKGRIRGCSCDPGAKCYLGREYFGNYPQICGPVVLEPAELSSESGAPRAKNSNFYTCVAHTHSTELGHCVELQLA